ncbi:MAG: fatty acid desaturase [Chlamydiota bacterium]|nr:fatty acid desaturase [Chlamydiota bacterium]
MIKASAIAWGDLLFIGAYHLALLVGLPFFFLYHAPISSSLYWIAFALLYLSGLAITAGYHRLFSHRAYKAHPIIQGIVLFFATMATQGSALRWCFDHRRHHAFVDGDKDPYSINKGFLYAHILWIFKKGEAIIPSMVSDLLKNPLIRFQHRFYVPLMFLTNGLVTLLVGALTGDYLGALVITWGIRLFLLHHFTWFINSLAHTWGAQSFSREHSAVDNYLISLLTFGEGYHNYHHTFDKDYRNGTKWYHFDPTKWLIWTLSKFGLASRLYSVSPFRIEAQRIQENRTIIEKYIGQLTNPEHIAWFKEQSDRLINSLTTSLSTIQSLSKKYQQAQQEALSKLEKKSIKKELNRMKKEFHLGWNSLFLFMQEAGCH